MAATYSPQTNGQETQQQPPAHQQPAPKPKGNTGSWFNQMKGNTVPQLTSKILRLASNKVGGGRKTIQTRYKELNDTVTKLKTLVDSNPTHNAHLVDADNETSNHHTDLIDAIAYLMPRPQDWASTTHNAVGAVSIITKILTSFDTSKWDFEQGVPVAVKSLYHDDAKKPASNTTSTTTSSAASRAIAKSGWGKVKKVVKLNAIVKRINGTDRDTAQERFIHLGTSAPLLYIIFSLPKNSKPIVEPDSAVTLVEALVTAGVSPSRYEDAILTQALICGWTKCSNYLKQRSSTQSVTSAEAKLARSLEQQVRFKGYGAKTKDIPTLNTEASAGLILHFETSQLEDFVNHASLSADNTRLVTSCSDGKVHIFSLPKGGLKSNQPVKVLVRVRLEGSVMHTNWSPDGQRLAIAASSGVVSVIDSDDGIALTQNMVHINPETEDLSKVYTVEFSPDGKRIVTCAYDGILRVFNAEDGELVTMSEDLEDGVFRGSHCGVDGKTFVTAWQSGNIRVFGISDTGVEVLATASNPLAMHNSVSCSKDGTRFVVGGGDGVVRIYRTASAALELELPQHGSSVSSAVFSKDDSSVITVTGSGVVRIFESNAGQLLTCSACPFDAKWVQSATLSYDGNLLAVASTDGYARTLLFNNKVGDYYDVANDGATIGKDKVVEFKAQVLVKNGQVDPQESLEC